VTASKSIARAANLRTAIVTTQQGRVAGAVDADGVGRFLGIPFAAPPVGALRWRAAQPPASWKGVRAADSLRRELHAGRGGCQAAVDRRSS